MPSKVDSLSNNNYLTGLVLVSLLVVGIGGFVGNSLIKAINHDSKVSAAKSTANKTLDSDVTAAPQLISGYNNLSESQRLVLKDALPTSGDFPGLISLLEVAGLQAGINITSISPSTADTSATTSTSDSTTTTSTSQVASASQEYDFSFAASGSYASLLKLFTNLEHSARPIRISGLQLSGSGSSMTASVDAATYYTGEAALPFSTETIK